MALVALVVTAGIGPADARAARPSARRGGPTTTSTPKPKAKPATKATSPSTTRPTPTPTSTSTTAGSPARGATAPSTRGPTAASTPGSPASPASPATGTVPQPATAAGAPSSPASLHTSVTLLSDGTAPFADWKPGDFDVPTGNGTTHDPGDDLNANNGIVRTLDTSQFKVEYSVDPPPLPPPSWSSGPITLVVTVGAGARILAGWVPGASTCPGGFSINLARTTLTCNLGTFTVATTASFSLPVVAPMSMLDGTPFTVGSSLTETANPVTATGTSPVVRVSAAPRYELVKEVTNAVTVTGPNPPGGPGLQQEWTIGIRGLAADPRGLSALQEPIVLDDLVHTNNGVPVWLQSCGELFVNGWPSLVGIVTSPASQVGAATVSCSPTPPSPTPISQTVPFTVTLTGIDWNRAGAPPTLNNANGALPPNRQGLVAYFTVRTWSSIADIDAAVPPPGDSAGSVLVWDTVETDGPGQCAPNSGMFPPWSPNGAQSTWNPVDIANRPNLGNQLEPVVSSGGTAKNGACIFVKLAPAGMFSKGSLTPLIHGGGVLPGTTTESSIQLTNTGNVAYPAGVVLCDKWDNSRFGPAGAGFLSSVGSYTGPFTFEYGTGNWGSSGTGGWAAQATTNCSNSAIAWVPAVDFTNTNAGGLPNVDSVNAVRITVTAPVPIGQNVIFWPAWTMRPGIPIGDEFRNYSAFFSPVATGGGWSVSTCAIAPSCPPGLVVGQPAGANSHWWTTIAGTVEVAKDRVGPTTYNAGDTMSAWRIRVGGRGRNDILQPTSFPVGVPQQTTNVVLRDILPAGLSYVPGSLVPAIGFPNPGPPTVLPNTPSAGKTTLVWNLGTLPWLPANTFNYDFRFDVKIDAFTAPGTYLNEAVAETPDDKSKLGSVANDLRRATATVDVVAARRAVIDKSVSSTQLSPGDTVVYTLSYGNPSAMVIDSMDAIDLLPFDGDPRGSVFPGGSFTLAGLTPSGHGEVAWASTTGPTTLDLLDGTADGFLDPANAGPVGSAQWPCKTADVGTGACPAIASASQVTAIRFVGTGPGFLQAGAGPFPVTVAFDVGPCTTDGHVANSWLSRFQGLTFPVRFAAQTASLTGCRPGEVVPVVQPLPPGTVPPGAVPPEAVPPEAVPPGAEGAFGAGFLAGTGAPIDPLTRMAVLALALGLLAVAATRTRRRERRQAFSAWVEHADLTQLRRFTQVVSGSIRDDRPSATIVESR